MLKEARRTNHARTCPDSAGFARTDASTIAFIALTLTPLETQSLHSHALHLIIEYVDLVGEPRIPRLLCIAARKNSTTIWPAV
jgi:hypothetical protein